MTVEPSAYDLILGQLARIESKLDRLPDNFLLRNEYEKRHEELLRAIARSEADATNDFMVLTNRVKQCEDNFQRLLWAFGATIGTAVLGLFFFVIQGHIVF